ncbi:MAG TPA: hypothetical protein VHG51_14640 [Longimicrobiaceae bacterium]|nr:hypothetical protein [Longimicrobiaceae bacterium]
MRLRIPALFTALLALALVAPAGSAAQAAASLNGTFTYNAQASDNVNAAIDDAVARMNFVMRPVARGRLRKTNQPYQRVQISHNPQQVSVTMDGRPAIVTPANGTPMDWTREDGEKLKVSTEWENSALEQTFKAEDGQRVNSYTVSPDGRTLTMNVTVTSPRLPKPLTYKLVYNRAS